MFKFKKLPPVARNFYAVCGALFFVWMLFLDQNDLITRLKMGSKLRDLESQKEYYIERISEVEKDRNELLTNKELLEKFAREKYLMRKETEDVFVIVEE